jgi:hypothetical protein
MHLAVDELHLRWVQRVVASILRSRIGADARIGSDDDGLDLHGHLGLEAI